MFSKLFRVVSSKHKSLMVISLFVLCNKPTAIIAKTIKGKGITFMENQVGWHGKAPSQQEYEQAIKELEREN